MRKFPLRNVVRLEAAAAAHCRANGDKKFAVSKLWPIKLQRVAFGFRIPRRVVAGLNK